METRPHLKVICDTLQSFWEGKLKGHDGQEAIKLDVNIPPRMGKSRTLYLFEAWLLGNDSKVRIITGSYNDSTAGDFSRYTRDEITAIPTSPTDYTYKEIFGKTIKKGDSSIERWALEGEFFNYLGTGVGGSVTGKGCNLLVIDDPIKGATEAYNETYMNNVWRWITGTLLSRFEKNGRIILNMTRWPNDDPCERFQKTALWDRTYVLSMKIETDGELLCDELMDKEKLEILRGTMDSGVFLANYYQITVDKREVLYDKLRVYDELPEDWDNKISYTDTADAGTDYLCHISGIVSDGYIYVTDVVYTTKPQEESESMVVDSIIKNEPLKCWFESNSGGRAFAKRIEKKLRKAKCSSHVEWFHQSENKKSRILSNSTGVCEYVLFPRNWNIRWPDYYEDMVTGKRSALGKGHDDAFDATTGLYEKATKGEAAIFI